jgi:L-aminopeptidase/D-esterase-like protein
MTTSFAPCGLVVGHATDVAGATGCTVVPVPAPTEPSAGSALAVSHAS